MRLLVTNTQKPQAYYIVLALRQHADWIVAAMDRPRSYAAYSRYVDARHTIPTPNTDIDAGLLQNSNTAAEQDYVTAILDICSRENIDTIVPSNEPDIYVLSKNKHRLKEAGITATVPDFDDLVPLIDKADTLRIAQESGFPCPRTLLNGEEPDLLSRAMEIGPPWVIKPRSSSGGAGMSIVTDPAALMERLSAVARNYREPMIQELVPGSEKQNFYVIVGADGTVKFIHCPEIVRYSRRLYRNSTAAALSRTEHPWLSQVKDLVEALGVRGALTVQTKIDARDGTPKLMEINTGIRTRCWYWLGLGVNSPLHCVEIERQVADVRAGPIESGVMMLDPTEDIVNLATEIADWAVYRVRTSVFRKKPVDARNAPASPGQIAVSYFRNYLGNHKKVYSPLFTNLLRDPKPTFLASFLLARHAIMNLRNVGT